jgi:hypothetical protein
MLIALTEDDSVTHSTCMCMHLTQSHDYIMLNYPAGTHTTIGEISWLFSLLTVSITVINLRAAVMMFGLFVHAPSRCLAYFQGN